MIELQVEGFRARRRVAQVTTGSEPCIQFDLVTRRRLHEPRASARPQAAAAGGVAGAAGAAAAAGAALPAAAPAGFMERDFSSFIIGDGPVTASVITTIRWRSTASLNLNACSSSASVSWLHSMFMST